MAKLFAVLEGVQDRVVLSGRVKIDETLRPLARADQPRMPDGSRMPGGFSKSKICVGVGCDGSDRSVFAREGLDKTSGARKMEAFGSRIAPGSVLVHDKENEHNRLVREIGLKSVAYDSKALCRLPDAENPSGEANRLCFLLKAFLDSHSGFDRDDLKGYLNLFRVIINPPASKMEKSRLRARSGHDQPENASPPGLLQSIFSSNYPFLFEPIRTKYITRRQLERLPRPTRQQGC